jgi:uncharacterized protein with PQ loop repeat
LALFLGALVAIVLMALYLNVYRRTDQIVLCLILMTFSDLAFQSFTPAVIAGLFAVSLSVLGNASTLLQLEHVVAQKDARFINIPIVFASLCNSLIWFVYSCLIHDLPNFLSTSFAILVMSVNLVFWLWAHGFV